MIRVLKENTVLRASQVHFRRGGVGWLGRNLNGAFHILNFTWEAILLFFQDLDNS